MIMKKQIILAVSLIFFAATMQGQALNRFFEKYADDERFSYAKFAAMQTLSIEITSANKAFVDGLEKEVLDILKKENYILNVESREKGERSYIYNHPRGETVIMNKDKKEWDILWTTNTNNKKKRADMGEWNGFNLNNLGSFNFPLDSTFFKSLGSLENLKELKNLDFSKNFKDFEQWKNLNLEDWKKLNMDSLRIKNKKK